MGSGVRNDGEESGQGSSGTSSTETRVPPLSPVRTGSVGPLPSVGPSFTLSLVRPHKQDTGSRVRPHPPPPPVGSRGVRFDTPSSVQSETPSAFPTICLHPQLRPRPEGKRGPLVPVNLREPVPGLLPSRLVCRPVYNLNCTGHSTSGLLWDGEVSTREGPGSVEFPVSVNSVPLKRLGRIDVTRYLPPQTLSISRWEAECPQWRESEEMSVKSSPIHGTEHRPLLSGPSLCTCAPTSYTDEQCFRPKPQDDI